MKIKLLYIPVLLLLFLFISCQNDNPVYPDSTDTNINPIGSNLNWLDLPQLKGNSVTEAISTSEVIRGDKGGLIQLKYTEKDGPFGDFKVTATLDIPKDAFDGIITFTVTVDDGTTYVDFDPHPMSFYLPLKLDLQYKGVDISDINEEDLVFAYVVDGNIVEFPGYRKIDINYDKNEISVTDAKIEHFSRFGFCR